VTFNGKLTGDLGSNKLNSKFFYWKYNKWNKYSKRKHTNVYDQNGHVVGTINSNGTLLLAQITPIQRYQFDNTAAGHGEVSYLHNENYKEAVAVKLNRLRTGFSMTPTNLSISQRGRPGGGVSNNNLCNYPR